MRPPPESIEPGNDPTSRRVAFRNAPHRRGCNATHRRVRSLLISTTCPPRNTR
uniref:Uncharacterized protein n=1 Tax=uncultured marine virus TaxID=186617 RepID=A0A0F7L935_9VIRU|nr:hypothetical protein [uncultured marine virus]